MRLLRGEEDPAGELSHLGALLRYCTVLYCTVLYCTVLLRRKAEEGVRVLVLIWNDKSSGAATGREGMMG